MKRDGGPAFPRPHSEVSMSRPESAQIGLTKRELFAGMAIQGILANSAYRTNDKMATLAVEVADALIEKLEIE